MAEGWRGRGHGGELIDSLVGELRGSALGLVLETSEPRLGFYARHGGRVIEDARGYRVPKLGAEGTLAYTLVWIPLREGAGVPAGEALRALVTAMLVEGYPLAPTDRLVREVVEGLAG